MQSQTGSIDPSSPLLAGGFERGPLPRLLRLAALDAQDLWAVALYAALGGALSLVTPVVVQALVGTVAFGSVLQPILVLSLAVTLALLLAAVLKALQLRVVEALQQRVFARVVLLLGARATRLRPEALAHTDGPSQHHRFFDVLTVQKAAASLLLEGVAQLLQLLAGVTLLAFYHPLLLAFDAALFAGLGVVFFGLGWGGVRTAVYESKEKYAVAAWLTGLARPLAVLRGTVARRLAPSRTEELVRHWLDARRGHYRVVFRQAVGALALYVLASAALLGLGGYLVVQRQLTLGQLVAAEVVVSAVLAGLVGFVKQVESFYDLVSAADKLGGLLDLPAERADGDVHFDDLPSGARLELRGAAYSYSAGAPLALAPQSLLLAPGARVALTAPSGAGRSTLAALLVGLRVPTQGQLLFDGVDARAADPSALRARALLLSRTPELLDGTLRENLTLGRADLTDAQLRSALERAGLRAWLLTVPEGLDLPLRADGAPLPSSVAQRVCVARALAQSPRLLVLDGGLDALDPAARAPLFDLLAASDAPWTLAFLCAPEEPLAARCTARHPLATAEAHS